jgi:hypothetical protein
LFVAGYPDGGIELFFCKKKNHEEVIMLKGKRLLLFVVFTFLLSISVTAWAAVGPQYIITVVAGLGGKITPTTVTVTTGTNKTFTIKPLKGYHLAEMKINGEAVFKDRKDASIPNDGSDPPIPSDASLIRSGTTKVYKYHFTGISKDHSLEAIFEPDTFSLEISKVGVGSGKVASLPEGVDCGDDCIGIFSYNTPVILTVEEDEGSTFDGWSGKCKGGNRTCTVKMTKASAATARFARVYELSVDITGNGTVKSSPGGIICGTDCMDLYKENTVVKLKAIAAEGSKTSGWAGCTTSSGAACTVVMDGTKNVTASFVPKGLPEIPLYTELNFDNLPESKILDTPSVIPKRNLTAGHCYLESFAVQMAYIVPSVTMEEVFTFAGLGAALSYDSFNKGFTSSPQKDWTWPLQKRAYENYGVRFVIGFSSGMSNEYLKGAYAMLSHASGEEALKNLKAVINSGRSVQVHIDLSYLPNSTFMPGASHFIIITGYDADAVYWTDPEPDYIDFPIDPREYVNVKIPLQNFMEAWEQAGQVGKGSFVCTGPYWMLFLEEKEYSQIKKKSVSEILAMQKALSANNASVIEKYLNTNISNTPWQKIWTAKRLFADYLIDNNFIAAGNMYKSLADDYWNCMQLSLNEQRIKLDTVIKPKEIEARSLY